MGGVLSVGAGAAVTVEIRILGGEPGDTIELVSRNGRRSGLERLQIVSDEIRTLQFTSDGSHDWVRANLRDGDGRLLLLTNPVYLNLPGERGRR